MKGITVEKIEELSSDCRFHRLEIMRCDPRAVDVSVQAAFDCQPSPSLTLTARYTTMRGGLRRPLLTYAVRARFAADRECHRAMVTPSAVYMNEDLLRAMLVVTLGALRGMLALRTHSTPLGSRPLPLFNIDSLMEHHSGLEVMTEG